MKNIKRGDISSHQFYHDTYITRYRHGSVVSRVRTYFDNVSVRGIEAQASRTNEQARTGLSLGDS